MVQLLVQARAHVNAANRCLHRVMCVCCARQRFACQPRHSLHTRDVTAVVPRHGCSPLHFAAINGRLEVAQLLLGASADLNMKERCDP